MLRQVVRTADGSVVVGPFDPTPRVWGFSHDSAHVIAGFEDGTIQVMPLEGGRTGLRLCSADDDFVDLISQSPDCSLLASIDDTNYISRSLRVWSMIAPILDLEPQTNPSPSSGPRQTFSGVFDECHTDKDGWLVNSSNDRLFWLPSEIAKAGLSPFVSLIITRSGTLQVPKQKLLIGNEWANCYVAE